MHTDHFTVPLLSICAYEDKRKLVPSGDIATPFLTSALAGGESSVSRPGRFTTGGKVPDTHWM
jgi:hypothetical protein